MQSLQSFLDRAGFTIERKVYWGEMDALGHVNNVQYLRYFEDLRTDLIQAYAQELQRGDTGPVVAEVSCQFLAPVFYPDTLHLGLTVEHIGNSQVIQQYHIYSVSQSAEVAIGRARLVNINTETGKKQNLLESQKAVYARYLVDQPSAGD